MSGRIPRWLHALTVRAWQAHTRRWAAAPPRLDSWT